MRHEHDEEPFSLKDLDARDERGRIFDDAVAEGFSDDEAQEIANIEMDYKSVGPEVFYGVSRND